MAVCLVMNVGFRNKGDALMVQAVLDRLEPDVAVAFPLSATIFSRRFRKTHPSVVMWDMPCGSWRRHAARIAVSTLGVVVGLLPSRVRCRIGYLTRRDVDVVIDLSGYCFGDHWGEDKIRSSTTEYRRWADAGVAVVLLPKTWGPFDEIDRRLVDHLFDPVSLAFARDRRSEETLGGLLSSTNRPKMSFAPDYTGAVKPSPPPEGTGGHFVIIPNRRMVDSGLLTEDAYLDFLSHAHRTLREVGPTAMLLHETSGDIWFKSKAERLGIDRDAIWTFDDERVVKGVVAASRGVVTSRLHGLYNSLNAGVPVLVAAWSFKYVEALRHYGCETALLDPTDLAGSFDVKAPLLISDELRRNSIRAMRGARQRIDIQNDEMWMKVAATFSSAGVSVPVRPTSKG